MYERTDNCTELFLDFGRRVEVEWRKTLTNDDRHVVVEEWHNKQSYPLMLSKGKPTAPAEMAVKLSSSFFESINGKFRIIINKETPSNVIE
jgi:hypothetical protein